jgi:uncharacterized membrane protein
MYFTVLLGISNGMRTMTPMAVVCWAAYAGWLPVEHTWAFWTAKLITPVVFTLAALGEYVGDTLPQTPSRTTLPQAAARLFFGVLVGLIVATALGQPKAGGVIFGAVGALIGTFGGVRWRAWGARVCGRDLPAALIESACAVLLALLALLQIHHQIVRFADRAILCVRDLVA